MPPTSENSADLALGESASDAAGTAAPLFGIVLGSVVMIVLALNALAY
jgi:hypothetical protein